jgi:cell division septum initiation protein DivIVA
MEVFVMDGTGFLRTVRVGGFDKKDVLAYVDDLNTKIYSLEAELDEKKALLEGASSGGTVDTSKYDELLAADKAKITELQTNNNSLKNQMSILEEDVAAANKELESLKKKNSALEDELQEAKNKLASGEGAADSAMDLSNVFIEAQKTANNLVSQAKESAKKMDDDAKKLANQVVDDANSKASSIVKTAEDRASKIMTEAEDKTAEARAAVANLKNVIAGEVNDIESNIHKLSEVLQIFSNESLSKLTEARGVIDKAKESLGKPPVAGPAPVSRPVAGPAPAPRPAAGPATPPRRPREPTRLRRLRPHGRKPPLPGPRVSSGSI